MAFESCVGDWKRSEAALRVDERGCRTPYVCIIGFLGDSVWYFHAELLLEFPFVFIHFE